MEETVKLQKYLAEAGIASRRKSEEYIKLGLVKVNGQIAKLGDRVTGKEQISINGEMLNVEQKEYYLLNKPLDYVSTSKDQFGRKNIIEIIKSDKRLVTAGRLDMYTTGAILITNDGEFVNKFTHPSNNVEKEYYVTIKGKIKELDLLKLQNGVEISLDKYIKSDTEVFNQGNKYKTKPAKVKILGYNIDKDQQRISVIITEGKNRQVRKMFKELKYSVIALHRNRIGNLEVKNLKPGEYRKLKFAEVKAFF